MSCHLSLYTGRTVCRVVTKSHNYEKIISLSTICMVALRLVLKGYIGCKMRDNYQLECLNAERRGAGTSASASCDDDTIIALFSTRPKRRG